MAVKVVKVCATKQANRCQRQAVRLSWPGWVGDRLWGWLAIDVVVDGVPCGEWRREQRRMR